MSAPADDLLVIADRVQTFDEPAAVEPDAVLVRGGRIAAIGSATDLHGVATGVPVLEAPGATVMPGFTDSHIHLTEWALALRDAELSATESPAEAAAVVADAARDTPSEWVRGRGWNAHRWGGSYPDRDVLDAALPDRPVALQSHDMHALWVNAEALRRAGIDRDTPDPDGGRIVRDEAGEPTGLLLETAGALVSGMVPAADEEEILAAVAAAQARLHAWGITGVHAFPSIHIPDPDPLGMLESLHSREKLQLRVLQHLPFDELDRAIEAGLRSGAGDEWIRVGGVKMFLDGALGSRTAWMREPYEDSADCGVQTLDEAVFRHTVDRAAAAGIATTVHAIGDAAVALALDVLSAAARDRIAMPHRIEHVQCCPPERLRDAGAAGITCSMQPAHLMTDWLIAEQSWGRDRSRTTYAFRSLAGHGAVLAFGSDAPVEPADPRLGLYAAVARTDTQGGPAGGWGPHERIDLGAAFRGYTIGPAIAAGQPELGRIRVGAPADLAVWEGDRPQPSGAGLLELSCVATVVGGQRVHG